MNDIDVINMAMIFLGKEPLGTLNEDRPDAWAVKASWETCREAFLQEHPWSFAKRTRMLSPVKEESALYRYAYKAPVDMLQPIRVIPRGVPGFPGTLPFELNLDETGEFHVVYCDRDEVALQYITRAVKVKDIPPIAREALAYRLAFTISQAIINDPTDLQVKSQAYQMYLAKAKASDVKSRTYPAGGAWRANASRFMDADMLDYLEGNG